MPSRAHARQILDTYIKAWMTQDPDLICTIFTEKDAIYHERVLREPIRDRSGIYEYWQSKVIRCQGNIVAKLLSVYLDGDTVIAEWDACFDDLVQGGQKHMQEIAVLEFEGGLIKSLREYWASEVVVAP